MEVKLQPPHPSQRLVSGPESACSLISGFFGDKPQPEAIRDPTLSHLMSINSGVMKGASYEEQQTLRNCQGF